MKNAFLGFLLSVLFAPSAWACSCMLKTDEQFARESDNIYFATLQEAKLIEGDGERWPYIEGRFQVRRTLKGKTPSAHIALATNADGGACGETMVVAATYVLFLRDGATGLSACDGARVIGSVEEDELAAKVEATRAKRTAK